MSEDNTNGCDGPHDWKAPVAFGVMGFLILIGIGGCGYLWMHSESSEPFIKIEMKSDKP